MDLFNNLIFGFGVAFSLQNLLYCLIGVSVGTLIGVLILGVIQTIITFEGTLSSWWTKIAIGLLLLGFILLQRFLQSSAGRGGLGVANPAMARP